MVLCSIDQCRKQFLIHYFHLPLFSIISIHPYVSAHKLAWIRLCVPSFITLIMIVMYTSYCINSVRIWVDLFYFNQCLCKYFEFFFYINIFICSNCCSIHNAKGNLANHCKQLFAAQSHCLAVFFSQIKINIIITLNALLARIRDTMMLITTTTNRGSVEMTCTNHQLLKIAILYSALA